MGKISEIVYEWVKFSIWVVYIWVCYLTSPSIRMGRGPGTLAASPYPHHGKLPPPRDLYIASYVYGNQIQSQSWGISCIYE